MADTLYTDILKYPPSELDTIIGYDSGPPARYSSPIRQQNRTFSRCRECGKARQARGFRSTSHVGSHGFETARTLLISSWQVSPRLLMLYCRKPAHLGIEELE